MKYPACEPKNFIRVIFSSGLISILLSAIVATPTQQSEPDNVSNATDSQLIPPSNQSPPSSQVNQTPQTNPPLPSLNCILFQDIGCKTQCVVTYNLLQLRTTGTCVSGNLCSCTIENMTLKELWKKKFDSTEVLEKIEENKDLSDKVLKVLQNPSRSALESGKELQSILHPDLFKNLRVKYILETGQPRPVLSLLKKNYVDKQKPLIKDTTELESLNYGKSLRDYLEDNKSNNQLIQKVFELIRQTENNVLVKILDQFLDQHKDIVEGKYEMTAEEILLQNIPKQLTTNEALAIIITNELIDMINQSQPEIQSETQPTNASEIN